MKNFTKTLRNFSLGLDEFAHSDANHCINTLTSIIRSVQKCIPRYGCIGADKGLFRPWKSSKIYTSELEKIKSFFSPLLKYLYTATLFLCLNFLLYFRKFKLSATMMPRCVAIIIMKTSCLLNETDYALHKMLYIIQNFRVLI
jgi:hypothetical protein